MSRAPRIALVVVAALVLAVAGALVLWSGSGEGGSSPGTGEARDADELSAALRRAVSLPGIMDHLRALQEIADDNGGNRSAGTSGYDESASYVASQLRDAGYEVELQEFGVPVFTHNSDPVLAESGPGGETFEDGAEFAVMLYSGSGEANAVVTPVDFDASAQSSSSGCETSDFDGFHEGAIALVRRGNCFFRDQALNAEQAGASAVLIAQEQGSDDVLRGTLTPDSGVGIPAVGITNELGGELSSGEGLLSVSVDASIEERPTHNLLAETSTGNADEVIMVGAHLDSVPAGPGINDNGSGVATILEVAQEIVSLEPPTRIRFAFWGAEEFGLIGSAHYVTNLSTSEQDQIAGYLNFDMLGSPNYVRFVYDGRRAGAGSVEASTAIQDLFENYFADENLETDVIGLEGRSDHAFFDRVGIPVGGLFSGADDVKTQAEASTYGGKVGEIHDACYHQSCDTLDNVNREVLDELADGVAHAVATLAAAPDIVNGDG
jgi:Zn-dependent M28 family amino/carboxypeptidase